MKTVFVLGVLLGLAWPLEEPVMPLSRSKIDAMVTGLKAVRTKHEPTWREIARYLAPNTYRGELSDFERGDDLDDEILDSIAFGARETLESGFLAHVTSPARPWILLKPEDDPELSEFGPVASWLDRLVALTHQTFQNAGVYEELQSFYGTEALYANGMLWHEEDMESVLHVRSLPIGTWWVGKGRRGMPGVFYREFRYTVLEAVEEFGRRRPDGSWDTSNFSARVADAYGKGNYQEPVDIGHLVYPNPQWNPHDAFSFAKRWASVHYELATPVNRLRDREEERLFLSVGGYDHFPSLHGVWDLIAGDTYGYHCPGRNSLPDVKELYHGEMKIMSAQDKMLDPPTMGPVGMKGHFRDQIPFLAGQHVWLPDGDIQKSGIRPVYQVDFRTDHAQARNDQKRRQINETWHADIFRMLDFLEERQRTAFEIAKREQERLSRISRVVNRNDRRVFDPLVENTVRWLIRQGRVGPIPQELQGRRLSIQYISTAHHAMRAIGLSAIDQVLGTLGPLVQIDPSARHKIDFWQVLDEVGSRTGAPARIFRSDEEAAARAQQAAEAEAAARQAEELKAATSGVRDLAAADTQGKNALTDLVRAAAEQGAA